MVVDDYNLAILESGRMMAHTIIDLLENNAEKSKQITENFSPKFKKKEYLNLLRSLTNEEEYIN